MRARLSVLVVGVLITSCSGDGSTTPSFTPDFPIRYVNIGPSGNPTAENAPYPSVTVSNGTRTETYTWEIRDAQDRKVPGASVFFVATNSTITPQHATSNSDARLTFSWAYPYPGSDNGPIPDLKYCLAYHTECVPE